MALIGVLTKLISSPVLQQQPQRSLFYWIYLRFNAIDEDRLKKFGPDRTCAEWILRNGGAIKFTNSEDFLRDYNELPIEGTPVRLTEVDASDTTILDVGFDHFKGCNHVTKVILHNCNSLENKALEKLAFLSKTLLYLKISSCGNISDDGLLKLNILQKLKELLLIDLIAVKKKEHVSETLKSQMPNCNIQFK